jgi:glycosyltransferase involved in cell wall biosynthesis
MRRVLMTTTAYPPSIGGVQAYVADVRSHLESFAADVVTLWLENRTDWLLGTTLRLGPRAPERLLPGIQTLAWSWSERLRMAPWALTYYGAIPVASRRLAAVMAPHVDRLMTPEHVLIHNHRIGREFLAIASLTVARRRGLPFVLTPYHHPRWHGYRYSAWTGVYRAADAVLTLTQAESRELQRLGVREDRLFVIGGAGDEPLPADPARFFRRIGRTPERLVLFVGQMYDYKGVATLVEAATALRARGTELDLAFVGPETPFSRQLLSQRSAPWIHVVGRVDNQTKWDAIEAATAVCVPSAQESFGRVYIEAWAKGKPVIGGRIPSVNDVITDGENGLLVDPGSVPQLERALERLLSDSALAARLGDRGRTTRDQRFTWKQVVARVERVYEGLLAQMPTAARPT